MTNHNPPDPHFRYSHTGITQPAMMCIPSILESPRMQQWQWISPLHNFRHAMMSMTNFAALPHPFSHLANPPSCIAALYAKEQGGYCLQMLIADMQSLSY